nr:immunoglobulin heavy chain junction region [Macaca mulatta]
CARPYGNGFFPFDNW